MVKPRKPDEEILRVLSLLALGRKWAVVRAETGWGAATISQAKSWFVSLPQEEAKAYAYGHPNEHGIMRLRIGLGPAKSAIPAETEAATTKRHEEHIQALLGLIQKCRDNLHALIRQHPVSEIGSPESSQSPVEPGWQIGDKGVRLSILPEAGKDPLTRRLWDSLCQHLSSGGSRWVVDKVTQWEKICAMELEGRVKLLGMIDSLIRERLAAPDWASVKRAEGKPTPLFAATIVSALVDNLRWDYPTVGGPRDNRYWGYYGNFGIGSAITPEASRAFQLYHQKLVIELGQDILSNRVRGIKVERETIAAAIDEGLAEILARGRIPGRCSYC